MSTTVMTVPGGRDVIDVTLVTDAAQYSDDDVLVVPQAVPGFSPASGVRVLTTVLLLDEADQAQAIDLIFFNAVASLGTINSAVGISDADARKIVGAVSITSNEYIDLVNSQLAVKTGLRIPLKLSSTGELWVGAVLRSGTPTYAASSLKLKLGFE